MMTELLFSFYGIPIALRARDGAVSGVLDHLHEDFSFFSREYISAPAHLIFELVHEKAPLEISRPGRVLFKTANCKVHGMGFHRTCDYGDGAAVFASNWRDRYFRIYSPDLDDLYEISYMAILSAAGEALDERHFHRVHALGLTAGQKGVLAILPKGGGKSALALQLAKDPAIRIFSDESPLIHEGRLYPYPVRMALTPGTVEALGLASAGARAFPRRKFETKMLFPIPPEKIAEPADATHVLVGVKGRNASIKKCRAFRVLDALNRSMVVGWGVAQMAEHMIRVDSLPFLPGIAVSRLKEAGRVSRRAAGFVFQYTEDARENARVLEAFLTGI